MNSSHLFSGTLGLPPAYDEAQVSVNIRQAVADVAADEVSFSKKIDHYRSQQTSFDSSIILLSLGSVAAAFYKSTTAALGGVAIVTNGAIAYRSYYDPEGEGAAYIKATNDLRCLATSGAAMQTANPQALLSEVATLQIAIDKVIATSSALSASAVSASQTQQAKDDGNDAASKAIDAARSVQTALLAELEAYNSAPSTITQGHNAILNYIALKKHRAYVDAGATKTAINAAVAKSSTADAQSQVGDSKLSDAKTALAKAQTTSKDTTKAAPETPATSPATVNAALTAKSLVAIPAGATPAATNTQQISALVQATSDALTMAMPKPKFTQKITDLTLCTSDL